MKFSDIHFPNNHITPSAASLVGLYFLASIIHSYGTLVVKGKIFALYH